MRIKNHTSPVEYAVAEGLDENSGREMRERRVIEDLVVRDNRFKARSEQMARLIVGVKREALNDESPDKIAELIGIELDASNERTKTDDAETSVENDILQAVGTSS